jgi:hypothetical protein
MPVNVDIDITDAKVTFALNSPGGVVNEWRNKVLREIKALCIANAPVNNPLNAKHRTGRVGGYKKSFNTNKGGSGHEVTGQVWNSKPYAWFVEEGRGAALNTTQRFSWKGFVPPGRIAVVKNTKGYYGSHTIKYATNDVMEAQTDYYVPML